MATDAAALYYFVPVWGQRLVELGAKLLNLVAIRPDHGVQHLREELEKRLVGAALLQPESLILEDPVVGPVIRVEHAVLPDVASRRVEARIAALHAVKVVDASQEGVLVQAARPVCVAEYQSIDDAAPSEFSDPAFR